MRKADGFIRFRRAMLKNPRVLSFSGNMGMTKSACVAFPRKFQHQLRHSGGYLSRTHARGAEPAAHTTSRSNSSSETNTQPSASASGFARGPL